MVLKGPIGPNLDEYFRETISDLVLEAGTTTRVDLALVQRCKNVTVRGIVVDALTGLPIENPLIKPTGSGGERTDEDGLYVIENLGAGSYNAPGVQQLTASAVGYITLSKKITVFCGATITVNWGVNTGSEISAGATPYRRPGPSSSPDSWPSRGRLLGEVLADRADVQVEAPRGGARPSV